MRKNLRFLVFFFALALCIVFYHTSSVEAKTVYLNRTSMTLNYKQSYTLKLKNNKKKVTWSTGNKKIATVSKKGKVTTKKVSGTVTITATINKSTYYTCTIKVQKGFLSSSKLTLKKGAVATLDKSILYNATWKSSNKKIATVNKNGKITAKKAGKCKITATYKKKKHTCTVTVVSKASTVTIAPTTKPYNNKYTNLNTYNKYTRNMYTLRSYMTRFAEEGGGTIILAKGTYTIVGAVYVPSNVTIQLSNGTTIQKDWNTGTKNLKYQASIFCVISPKVITAVTAEKTAYMALHKGQEDTTYRYPSAVTKYNGSKSVVIKGTKGGTSVIDHKGKYYTFGISTGHANGLTVQDIQFKNMDGNHFIELNSSKNVLIQRCTFTDDVTTFGYNSSTGLYYYNNVIASGSTSPTIANKEAINIDTCDPNIAGFNNPWAYHDYTPCTGITVQNCTFTRIVRPIGSHKYTATYNSKTKKWSTQVYNTNIKILNNTFIDTGCNAIEACNWKNATISGNKISTVNNTIKNPYNYGTANFFRSINPSKTVNGKKVVDTNSSLKQKVAILICGGQNINIYNNKIDNAIVGVAVFNLANKNGGAKYQQSAYKLTSTNINYIRNKNTYTNITSGCNYFFSNDSLYGKKSVSGKREYLEDEYNIDWNAILANYRAKYFKSTKGSASNTEASSTTEANTEVTTSSETTTSTTGTTSTTSTKNSEATTTQATENTENANSSDSTQMTEQ